MLIDFISQSNIPIEIKDLWDKLEEVEHEDISNVLHRYILLKDMASVLHGLRKGRFGSVASRVAHLSMDHIQEAAKQRLRSDWAFHK
jgi:hypothetical protein